MRKLKYLVIHCTATPDGREVTADDIKHWHTDSRSMGGRGWKQVGYTDLFHLDGTVERLVDNNEDDMVDQWEITNGAAGYNSISRHIVYAGGLDKHMKSCDTRTQEQRSSMVKYVRDFHTKHPDVVIVGHNTLNPAKACPCFDVAAWLKDIGITNK